MPHRLIIGNKAYSSWSLRPWILLATLHIPFEETVIALYRDDSKRKLLKYAPTGQVPVLIDEDVVVWESLSILEYLAEKFPRKGIWPSDPVARAHARSLCAEMHAGFVALRTNCSTNFRREPRERLLPAERAAAVAADVARIEKAWAGARRNFGAAGPFLFGLFCAADAMFAPVVNRLHVYKLPISRATRKYCDTMLALPAYRAWLADAAKETWVIEAFEK